jgi:hypothetical protein
VWAAQAVRLAGRIGPTVHIFSCGEAKPDLLSKARLIDRVFAATISATVGRHCVSAASAATVKTFKECASTNSLMCPLHTGPDNNHHQHREYGDIQQSVNHSSTKGLPFWGYDLSQAGKIPGMEISM